MSSLPEAPTDRLALRHQRRFRRWALRLFASHLLLAAVTVVVLALTIAIGETGEVAMLVGGLLTAIALPVWVVTAALAALSLFRGEPRPQIAIGLVAICLLLAFTVAPIGLRMLRDAVEAFG